MEDLFLILDSEDKGSFKSTIRSFFAQILKFLYRWMESAVDAIYTLAQANLGLGEWVESLSEKIFVALIIFMIFKVTLSIMTYLVNPDAFNDKSKGFQNIIKRIIIVLMLLISINPIFDFLHKFQDDLLEDGVVENLVLGTGNDTYFETSDGDRVYLIQISPYCEEWAPEHRTITFSRGESLALLSLKPFIQPVNENEGDVTERKEDLLNLNYCGADYSGEIAYIESSEEAFRNSIIGPSSAGDYLQWEYYNGYTGDWSLENNVYYLDFDYLWALVSGAVIFLLALTFCFDVVKRSLTLMVLQVMAPIPIISYVSPEGKSSNLLSTWFKKVGSTWVSLFIRLLALSFAISFIGAVCNSETFRNNEHGAIMQMIVIAGTLMFAKGLPKLLEEIIPGLKFDGGLELNPFKRISKEALGGNQLLGLGAAAIGAGMSGIANTITGVEKNLTGANRPGFGWNKNQGLKENLKNNIGATGRLARGGLKTFGSAVAGSASAGGRAFMKTSKDGRIFIGAKEGHLESQFAKQQRADLQRKGSTLGGRIAADANRWIGRENAAQRQQLTAAEQDIWIENELDSLRNAKLMLQRRKSSNNEAKITNQNKKDKATKDYRDLKTNFEAMNKRIDSQKPVKDEIEKLEWIKNTDFSSEVEQVKNSRIAKLNNEYSTKLQNAKNNEELEAIKAERDKKILEVKALDVVKYKQEKIDAQNEIVTKARTEYYNNNKEIDKILKSHIDAIDEIKSKNQEIASNKDFNYLDDKGKYNKSAIYKADDQVSLISAEFDTEEDRLNQELYDINIEEQRIAAQERRINEFKQTDEYINAHNKNSPPHADNASRKVAKGGQPEGWTLSGDINAGGTTGYGGNQYYSNSGTGRPGPRHGPPHGGGH